MSARARTRPPRIKADGVDIEIRNADKVFWPQLGLTKGDLVNYYTEVAPWLLPHLKGRPFTMKPYPDGAAGRSYFRWEIPAYAPRWVHRWTYHAVTEERVIDMVVIEGLAELVWVADQGCIEMHPWLSRCDDPAHPDLALFDLDAGPGSGFAQCLQVAAWMHAALERLGVRSYAKTTGHEGLHVLVPIERRYTFEAVRAWVHAFGLSLEAEHPKDVTLDKALERRQSRVLIDYSQNALGKSAVSPYSARATPEATVSTPLTWQEVEGGRVRPLDFTVLTLPARLRAVGDLMAPLARGQMLPDLKHS